MQQVHGGNEERSQSEVGELEPGRGVLPKTTKVCCPEGWDEPGGGPAQEGKPHKGQGFNSFEYQPGTVGGVIACSDMIGACTKREGNLHRWELHAVQSLLQGLSGQIGQMRYQHYSNVPYHPLASSNPPYSGFRGHLVQGN